MKLEFVATAVISAAFVLPVFTQDKPARQAPKADAPKAQPKAKVGQARLGTGLGTQSDG